MTTAELQQLAIEYKEILENSGARLSDRDHRLINGLVEYLAAVDACKESPLSAAERCEG